MIHDQNYYLDVEFLASSFVNIQTLYTHQYKISNRPKVSVDKLATVLIGQINIRQDKLTGVEFSISQNATIVPKDLEIIVRPLFGKVQKSNFVSEDFDNLRIIGIGIERIPFLMMTEEKLPIKKIDVIHNIQDPILVQKIRNAEILANQKFNQSESSFLSCFKGNSDIST